MAVYFNTPDSRTHGVFTVHASVAHCIKIMKVFGAVSQYEQHDSNDCRIYFHDESDGWDASKHYLYYVKPEVMEQIIDTLVKINYRFYAHRAASGIFVNIEIPI